MKEYVNGMIAELFNLVDIPKYVENLQLAYETIEVMRKQGWTIRITSVGVRKTCQFETYSFKFIYKRKLIYSYAVSDVVYDEKLNEMRLITESEKAERLWAMLIRAKVIYIKSLKKKNEKNK